jgi:lipoprotein NlpI
MLRILTITVVAFLTGSFGQSQTDFQFYNIALVKYNLGNYEGARQDLSKAIELNPDNITAYILRGSASYNLEDYSLAHSDYTEAINMIILDSRGVKVTVTDRRGNVIESGRTTKKDPDLAILYHNRGLASHALENYKEAIADYTRAIENEPDQAASYYFRGVAREAVDDYPGAAEDYNSAIGIDKELAPGYYRRGIMLHMLGDTEGACRDWDKALELGLDDARDQILEFCNNGAAGQ